MKKVDLEIYDISMTGSASGAYTMVLGVVDGVARIPVIIGGSEAQSIALELENMKASRPLTHDLYKDTLLQFDLEVTEVLVYKFHEGIFFAKIYVSNGDKIEEIDSRISDAVAIAVRFRAPIRCLMSIVNEAGIIPDNAELEMEFEVDEELEKSVSEIEPDLATLEEELKEAIENEDYELASELRDAIEKLKNKPKDE